jgi:hypothetical protein
MPKVTMSAEPIVWVRVRDERVPTGQSHPELGPLPMARDTGGLLGRFYKWLGEVDLWPLTRYGGLIDSGEFGGAFRPADAQKVIDWLRANGATSEG